MKRIEIIKYQCEICGAQYDTEDAARDCESRGTGTPYPPLKVGRLYKRIIGPIYEGSLRYTTPHSHGWSGLFMDNYYGDHWFDITDPNDWEEVL